MAISYLLVIFAVNNEYMPDQKHFEDGGDFKGLKVNKGINQPSSVNPGLINKLKNRRKKTLTADEYVGGILAGDINVLSQAVTLIESSRGDTYELGQEVIEKCLEHSGKSLRLGITGVPGAGKSTFIEALGLHLIEKGNKLAVLAIDPSSERSKGSILGDKTRMENLSSSKNAYIRPSPAAGSLGGVARKTRETVVLCEAAGFDTIFIETVGVGQSETAVRSMVDFFLLIQIAGAGDELQGMKRGIMEMADGIAINKADGDNIQRANQAKSHLTNALHLFPAPESGYFPKVIPCSSLTGNNIDKIWDMISDFARFTKDNSFFYSQRKDQAKYWMYETINELLKKSFYDNEEIKKRLMQYENLTLADKKSSFAAARELWDLYKNSFDNN